MSRPLAPFPLTLYTRQVSGGSLQLEPLLRQLAAEFARRGMDEHVAQLRAYYADHRARQRAARKQKHPSWTEDLVLEWLMILRVPPFDHILPVLERGVPCPACRKHEGQPYVACVFRGGCVRECRGCGARWLEVERE